MCVTPSLAGKDAKQLYTLRAYGDRVLWRGEGSQSRMLVKEPTPEFSDDPYVASSLRREFEFLRRFTHDRMLRPIGFDESRSAIHFEDAQCTLGQLLRQLDSMPIDLVLNVLHWTASGLALLHDQGMGHGSISTGGLIVDTRGQIKLGDFCGYVFRSEPPPLVSGLKYQAPEILGIEHGSPSPSSDLYCLGFLALELLTGKDFESLFGLGEDSERTPNWLGWHADVRRKLEHWHDSAPHAPVGLRRIVDELIVKDVAERKFKTARHLLVELQEFQTESTRRLPAFRGAGKKKAKVRPIVNPQPIALVHTETGEVRRFSPNRSVIFGTRSDCNVRLRGSASSHKHAYLAHQPDGWWIFDLHSRSGIMVNERGVHRSQLKSGDCVRMGKDEYRITIGAMKDDRKVNEFRLEDVIHKGSAGDLYRAKWEKDGGSHSVAVRVYADDHRNENSCVRRFLRGIPAAGRMRHPNILRLYRGGIPEGQNGGKMWLAMELATGGSLRDRLQKHGRLSVAEVVKMGQDIARGLVFAHGQGLVHRNLHPSCILFDSRGNAKIGEFSFMREQSSEDVNEATMMSNAASETMYLAPEQFLNVTPSARCDVYSLAACMYESLTGRAPIEKGEDIVTTMRRVLDQPPASVRSVRPEVSAELDQLIMNALAKNPKERTASASDFLASLESIMNCA